MPAGSIMVAEGLVNSPSAFAKRRKGLARISNSAPGFLGVECEDAVSKPCAITRRRRVRDPAGNVYSTIPISVLVQGVRPEPPREILDSSRSITYRGMILVYRVLDQDRFGKYDAYYFPRGIDPRLPPF